MARFRTVTVPSALEQLEAAAAGRAKAAGCKVQVPASEDVTRGHMHNSLSLGVQSIKGGDEAEDINSDLEE